MMLLLNAIFIINNFGLEFSKKFLLE